MLQEVDGRDEVASANQHDQVDGVVVALTAETASEVGAWVDGREEFVATWAEEAESPLAVLVGPCELRDEVWNRDVVAKLIQELLGETCGHDGGPRGC